MVNIDRDKAAQLGLNMSQVGSALASLLGGGYVNYFSLASRSYKVIPQVQQRSRLNGAAGAELSGGDGERHLRCRCRRSPRSRPRPCRRR